MFSQRRVNMELTSLCITQLISVFLLGHVQHSYAHTADATFPRIVPSRLQLFEYESLFINCEGFFNDLTEWRVMRKIKGVATICNNQWETTGPCNIKTAYSADSGEYWCESEGKKSNTVNITVTAGSVVLESPVLPLMEGEDVTLRCRSKTTSNGRAYYFKDGLFINTGVSRELTIHNVSKSDEGLYTCSISGVGKSAESWLAVKAGSVILESPALPVMEGEAVTLICRSKTSSNFTSDFYKDDRLIGSSSTGNMTIHSVSKSDEGLYKCSISGSGESAESWLAVRAYQEDRPDSGFPRVFTLLQMVVAALLVSLLLLLLIAVLHYKKHKGASTTPSSFPVPSLQNTEMTLAEPQEFPNPVATGSRNEKDEDESLSRAVYYTLGMVTTQQAIISRPGASRAAWTSVPYTRSKPHLTEEDCYYYTIS